MKTPAIVLKVIVLASSILLVGGCVSYRSGAWNFLKSADPSEKSAQPSTQEKKAPTFIPSSKAPLRASSFDYTIPQLSR